jgi:putative flavoprotein involved in K+ transport
MKIGPSRSRVIALVAWQVLSHVMTIRTPIGRKVKAKMAGSHGRAPVERVRPKDLAAAGVELVPRTDAVRDGRPVLADGRVADVANVIWCTGYRPDLRWIDLPILDEHGEPRQARGVSDIDGLYFVGRFFQYAFTSLLIGGVGRDASYIARHIASRAVMPATDGLPHTVSA